MLEPKKHITKIVPYPIDKKIEWDLKLDFNENLIGPSPKVLKAIQNISIDKIKYYPFYEKLLKAISEYNNIPTENIIAVNGSDEGYRYIFDAYCAFGDNVLNVTPTFSMPKIYGEIAHCNYIEVPYTQKWEFPIDEFLKKITNAIKLIIVTSPNSPTGNLIKDEDLIKIIEKAQNSLVVIDETYSSYANKTYVNLINEYDNVLVLKSMSKDFATAGLRLGYMLGDKKIISNIYRVASPYSVNSIAALAGEEALKDINHVEKVKKETEKSKEYLIKELKPFAKEVFPSFTNFLCVDFGERAKYIYNKLLKNKIKIKMLSGVAENCARITIPPLADAKKLINVLKKQQDLIVFDMDGVLVDASKSYRVAIQETFKFFANKDVSLETIRNFKNQGGYNNDWLLTHTLLMNEGIKVTYDEVVDKFNEFYIGNNGDGLIKNERWLLTKQELETLSEKFVLAIFTGRQRFEADYALRNLCVENLFDIIITSDLLQDEQQKPSPYGLNLIKSIVNPKKCYYLGDTKDDIKAGIEAKAETIGILPPQDKSEMLKDILKSEGAKIVFNETKEIIKYWEK